MKYVAINKKRLTSIFMVLVLFITCFSIRSTVAKAESIADLAMPILTFETFTKDMQDKENQYYAVEIEKDGNLRLQISGFHGDINIYSEMGEDIMTTSTSGGGLDAKAHLEKGIYYIKLSNGYADNAKYTIQTSFTPDKKTMISLSATIKKGETLQLSADVDPKETVKWKTNKSSIATVSSTGLVKALKKGTTIIYAIASESGTSTTIKIRVK